MSNDHECVKGLGLGLGYAYTLKGQAYTYVRISFFLFASHQLNITNLSLGNSYFLNPLQGISQVTD